MSDRVYAETSAVLSADFITMLDHHPESFNCLFFKAELATPEVVAPDAVSDVVGSIEGSERKIQYADPISTRARIVPDEGISLLAFEAGYGEDVRSGEDPVVILLKEAVVPKQSIITWTETIDESNAKTIEYYVLESKPFGKAPVAGMKHYCIPLMSAGEQES